MTPNNLYKTVHYPDPDYTRPLLEIPPEASQRFHERLEFLYGAKEAGAALLELERILRVYYAHKPLEMITLDQDSSPRERFSERDLVFIAYGDMVEGDQDLHPLQNLHHLAMEHLHAANTLHILPFFPYSSDRGFSVKDFKEVDAKLGAWEDIWDMDSDYQLMFDGVVNHVSSRSKFFNNYLNGVPGSEELFISFKSPDELSMEQRGKIFRPRTSDVLSAYYTINGPRYVWTTFSQDQIDLNYHSSKVLLYVLDLLLFYVRQGADIIRLDAVTYLWSEPGTACVHLEQTHQIIRLMRDVLNLVAPRVALITETNVPHRENISYFGDGCDQAQMIYNFALPPLVLHSFYREDATYLSDWAKTLTTPSDQTAFFNILDTHDGIGLLGARGILPEGELEFLVAMARNHGARVSYRAAASADKEPYEINTTWYSALNGRSNEALTLMVKRLTASRSIALALKGVPAVYLHGALGTENDYQAVEESGQLRDINRAKVNLDRFRAELRDPTSKTAQIRASLSQLGKLRVSEPAFHPQGGQVVLDLADEVFGLLRTSPDGSRLVLALTNVSAGLVSFDVDLAALGINTRHWLDLVGGAEWYSEDGALQMSMQAYDVVWLAPKVQD